MKDLTNCRQGQPLFVSDDLPHYGKVLGELFHQLVPLPPTGKPGRSNLYSRLWDVHLTRKAPAVACSMPWLKAKFAICVACYNLIRPHETLSRGEDRIFRPKTPAMAANVTDHQWTFVEQRAYPALCQ
jgi:hypothetical protein